MIEKFNLLISKKANAEAYTAGMNELRKEIQDIEQKIQSSNLEEEKGILSKEKEQKEKEIENLKFIYSEKKEDIKYEIEELKEELKKHINEFRNKAISREEYNKLIEDKKNKEVELEKCELYIQRAKEKLRELLNQDGGYEQDTASISKELDDLTAYRTYINEEIDELDNKLSDKIIIEDNIEKLKNMKGLEMKLVGLSYDSLEKWVESEQKSLEEVLGIKEKFEEKDTPPSDEEKGKEKDTPPSDEEKGKGKDTPPSDEEKGKGKDTPPSDEEKGKGKDTPPSDEGKGKGTDTPKPVLPLKNIKITIHPYSNKITLEAVDKNGQPVKEELDLNYDKKECKKVRKELTKKHKVNNSRRLDSNVLAVLDKMGCNKELSEYAEALDILKDDREKIYMFDLTYNLDYLYDSKELNHSEKRNVAKLAKRAKAIGADVSKKKCGIFARMKSWLNGNEPKLLEEKTDEREDSAVVEQAVQEQIDDRYKDNPNLEQENSVIVNKHGEPVAVGRRTGFVQTATVDESKAVAATKSKSEAGRKVVIEHPDGTKETGTRLGSEMVD